MQTCANEKCGGDSWFSPPPPTNIYQLILFQNCHISICAHFRLLSFAAAAAVCPSYLHSGLRKTLSCYEIGNGQRLWSCLFLSRRDDGCGAGGGDTEILTSLAIISLRVAHSAYMTGWKGNVT